MRNRIASSMPSTSRTMQPIPRPFEAAFCFPLAGFSLAIRPMVAVAGGGAVLLWGGPPGPRISVKIRLRVAPCRRHECLRHVATSLILINAYAWSAAGLLSGLLHFGED